MIKVITWTLCVILSSVLCVVSLIFFAKLGLLASASPGCNDLENRCLPEIGAFLAFIQSSVATFIAAITFISSVSILHAMRTRQNKLLFISSSVLFGVSFAISALKLLIPVFFNFGGE